MLLKQKLILFFSEIMRNIGFKRLYSCELLELKPNKIYSYPEHRCSHLMEWNQVRPNQLKPHPIKWPRTGNIDNRSAQSSWIRRIQLFRWINNAKPCSFRLTILLRWGSGRQTGLTVWVKTTGEGRVTRAPSSEVKWLLSVIASGE